MCKWGTNVTLSLRVPAELSSTGEAKVRDWYIDACIAPIVKALNDGGVHTVASCCGHGNMPGRIALADGRELLIARDTAEVERLQRGYSDIDGHGASHKREPVDGEARPQEDGDGIALIAAERRRQVSAEGWTPAHDAEHALGELSQAGAAYAKVASALTRGASANEFDADMMMSEGEWPFEASWWKPSDDPIRTLVKAGALIAAEIDRLRGILAASPGDGAAPPPGAE